MERNRIQSKGEFSFATNFKDVFQTSLDENTTISSINFIPKVSDHETSLLCRVETPGLQDVKEDEWILQIHCELIGKLFFNYEDMVVYFRFANKSNNTRRIS